FIVTGDTGRAMFDADTGEQLSPIGRDLARKVAEFDFRGEGEIEQLTLTNNPPPEYRAATPVWRAEFGDVDETWLYISPETGDVLARRNRVWRVYDFFWMLHIMDYGERDNFNNPLLRAFATTGLLFALSGLVLVGLRVAGGRYVNDLKRRPDPLQNGPAP
ncbi:MAG: PepSY domain-containing protein, partial [Parvularculaceae bacterium]